MAKTKGKFDPKAKQQFKGDGKERKFFLDHPAKRIIAVRLEGLKLDEEEYYHDREKAQIVIREPVNSDISIDVVYEKDWKRQETEEWGK